MMGAEAEKSCRIGSRVGTVTGGTMGEQGGLKARLRGNMVDRCQREAEQRDLRAS